MKPVALFRFFRFTFGRLIYVFINCIVILSLVMMNVQGAAAKNSSFSGTASPVPASPEGSLPSFIKLPSSWALWNSPPEGERVNLMGNTYVIRTYTNFKSPTVRSEGLHDIPVVTRINPVTGQEEAITNMDELRALNLYALWSEENFLVHAPYSYYDELARMFRDLAEAMDPNAFDGYLALMEFGKALLKVGISMIFPTGAPAAISFLGKALTFGSAYTSFVADMAKRPGASEMENMYGRALLAIQLLNATDQGELNTKFQEMGFTDIDDYLAKRNYSNVVSGASQLLKAGNVLRAYQSGFGYVISVKENGVIVAKGVYHGANLVNAAVGVGTGIIIDKLLLPGDFNTSVKQSMLSNHLHAAIASRLATQTARDRELLEYSRTPAELESRVNLVSLEAYRLYDVFYEMLVDYEFYLESIKKTGASGQIVIEQRQIDQIALQAEDWKSQYVDEIGSSVKRIAESLDFTLKAGYPDFTSGSFNQLSQYGVTPVSGSYVEPFTLFAEVISTSSTPPSPASVLIKGTRHTLSPVSVTQQGLVYLHRLEYKFQGLVVGEYPFTFEIGTFPATQPQSFKVESNSSGLPPSVSFFPPLQGVQVTGVTTLQAITLSGTISKVEFFVEDVLVCSDTKASWTCEWDTTTLGRDGPARLEVVATDTQNRTARATDTVTVLNDEFNAIPEIEVKTPNGETAYGHFTIKWQAEDLDDEAYISLYYDNNNTGYDGTLITQNIPSGLTSQWSHWNITDLPGGSSYYVYAVIDDRRGGVSRAYSPGKVTIATIQQGNNFSVTGYELTEEQGADMDGVPDAGEPLNLEITIRNDSGKKWCAVVGTLTTSSGGVTLTDNDVSYYAINSAEESDGSGSFNFSTDASFDGTLPFKLGLVYQDCNTTAPYKDSETVNIPLHPNDLAAPTITSGPTISNILPDSALVTWTTNEPTTSVVDYGMTTGYGTTLVDQTPVTTHQVMMRGLTGGFLHYFRVSSSDPSGNGPAQATGSFTTTNLGAGYQAEKVVYGLFGNPRDIAWDGSHLWVLSQVDFAKYRVYEFDPVNSTTLSMFDVNFFTNASQSVSALASDGTYLYLFERGNEELAKVTRTGNLVSRYTTLVDSPDGLVYGNGSLWVADDDGYMIRQLTMTGTIIRSFNAPGLATNDLGWNNNHLWAVDSLSGLLYELDLDGNILSGRPAGGVDQGLEFTDPTHFWVSDSGDNGRIARFSLVEDTTSPLITVAPAAAPSGSSAIISWETNEPADSRIEYGETAAYGLSTSSTLFGTTHAIPASSLLSNRTYHYRVGSKDMAGNDITWSGDYTFTTSGQSNYNVVNSFRLPYSWTWEGFDWNGTSLSAYTSTDQFITHDAVDGHTLNLMYYTPISPSIDPEDIEYVNGNLWVANDYGTESLIQVNGTTGAKISEIVLDTSHDNPKGITWDGSRLWVSDTDSDSILKINPSTGVIESSFAYPLNSIPGGLEYYNGYLWYVDTSAAGLIYQLSTTGAIISTIDPPGTSPYGITWGGGHLWVVDDSLDTVFRLDPASSSDPVVAQVYSENYIDLQRLEYFQVGSVVNIIACEQHAWAGLAATVTITSPGDARAINNAPMQDIGGGCYQYPWNTAGGSTTTSYNVEVRLTDGTRSDTDGLSRTPDLVIRLAHRGTFNTETSVQDVLNYGVGGFAWANSDLWVNNYRTVDKYTGGTGAVTLTFVPPLDAGNDPQPTEMDWESNYLYIPNNYWFRGGETPNVSKHNNTGGLVSTITLNGVWDISAIAVTGTYIWAYDYYKMRVCRFPMAGGNASLCFTPPTKGISGMEWDGTYLWLVDDYNDRLWKYDNSGVEVDRYTCPHCDYASMKGSQLWVYTGNVAGGPTGEYQVYKGLVWLPDLSMAALAAPSTSTPAGIAVPVTATVYIDNGSASNIILRFYDGNPAEGGTQIGTDINIPSLNPGTPFQTTINFQSGVIGTHMVYAVVDPNLQLTEFDENNNQQIIQIQVYDPDPEPPAISNVSAVDITGHIDGILEDNEQIRMFWQAVDASSSVASSSLTINGTTYPAAGSYQVTFGPLPEGRYPYTIQAVDTSGKTGTYEGILEIFPHALTITSVEPAAGTQSAPIGTRIAVQFGTKLKLASVSSTVMTAMTGTGEEVAGELTYQVEENMLVFIPHAELRNSTTYYISLPAGELIDTNNNTLASPYMWMFTTEPDTTAPVAHLSTGVGSGAQSLALPMALNSPALLVTTPDPLFFYGSVLDKNIYRYEIRVGKGESPTEWEIASRFGWVVDNSYLGSWNPAGMPNGLYTVSLVVTDTVGLVSTQDLLLDLQIPNIPPKNADLSISMTATPGTVLLGGTVNYHITVTNAGPEAGQSVTILDTLPAGVGLLSAMASQGSCSGSLAVTCQLGNIEVGGSATIDISVQVNDPPGSTLTNTATVSGNIIDPDETDNIASTNTTVSKAPGTFGKSSPANGSSGILPATTLAWSTSSRATAYEYCFDTTSDPTCSPWTSTTSTSAEITSLLPGTTYYWQVRATNSDSTTYADGSLPATWSFTTLSAPGTFSLVSPVNGTFTQPVVTLTWQSSPGAASYTVATCIKVPASEPCIYTYQAVGNQTSFQLNGLARGSRVLWSVQAENAAGSYATSQWSFDVSYLGAFSKTQPNDGTKTPQTSTTFAWDTSLNAQRYEICFDTTDNNLCDTNFWWNAGLNTSFFINGLTDNTIYYWQARSRYDFAGIMTYYEYANDGDWWSLVVINHPPRAFNKVAPANGESDVKRNQLMLSWEASDSTASYEYCIDANDDDLCQDNNWKTTLAETHAVLNGLDPGKDYYWQVRARNDLGVTTASSDWWHFITGTGTTVFLPMISR